MPKVDLHLHSTESDGMFSVPERLRQAKRHKLALVALTDHDTVKGVPLFLRLAKRAKLQAVAGVEISTDFHGKGLHILGYGIRHRDPKLKRFLIAQSQDRIRRAKEAVILLRDRGFRISFAQIRKEAGENIGKPHIAKAILADAINRRLLKERYGFVGDWGELIERFFDHAGQLGYVPRKKLQAHDAIRLIRRMGGISVLAHADRNFKSGEDPRAAIITLKRAGLQGIEVWTPRNVQRGKEYYLRLAEHLGLLVTGGTDNHETTALGVNIPEKQFQALLRRFA